MTELKPISSAQMNLLGMLINKGYVTLPSDVSSMSELTSAKADELIKLGNSIKNGEGAPQAQMSAPSQAPKPQYQQPFQQSAPQYQAPVPQPQSNQITVKKQSFSNFITTKGNKLIANALTDRARQTQFTATIVSAVANNPSLAECDFPTIVSGALQGEALKLPMGLGYFYLVPFKNKKKSDAYGYEVKDAQFQIGYKGYIQLAIRSGQYRNIEVIEVRQGELVEFNPLKGQVFDWITDYNVRKNTPVVGYVARIELVNGFTKEIYCTYEEMLDHADKYSQAFKKADYERLQRGEIPQRDLWKYSSFWYKDFDEMAKKTMLRKILSKWGIMSVDMQEAYNKDQAVIQENGDYTYIDSVSEETKYSDITDVNAMQENLSGTKEF